MEFSAQTTGKTNAESSNGEVFACSVDRIVDALAARAKADKYFASSDLRGDFVVQLKDLLNNRILDFDRSVWQGVGKSGRQLVARDFTLGAADDEKTFKNWILSLDKFSGTNISVNLSRFSGDEDGGMGALKFLKLALAGFDGAGAKTTLAATLDVDHPEIDDFIDFNARTDASNVVVKTVVRVSDEFMRAAEASAPFALLARNSGKTTETIDARELLRRMSVAGVGIQYDEAINSAHTIPHEGKIAAASRYLSIDNSCCMVASLNLPRFLSPKAKFEFDKFISAVETAVVALDLLISIGDYPTAAITKNAQNLRQIALGFTDLGEFLRAINVPLNSSAARDIAAAITSLMTATAYRRSAELADAIGESELMLRNRDEMLAVLSAQSESSFAKTDEIVDKELHINAEEIIFAANREWSNSLQLGAKSGWRNSQATALFAGYINSPNDELIKSEGELRLAAAIQPFLSGGIDVDVALSEDAGVCIEAWKLGLKLLSSTKRDNAAIKQQVSVPRICDAKIYDFVVDGKNVRLIVACDKGEKICEIIACGDLSYEMSALLEMANLCLDYGARVSELSKVFAATPFAPSGTTDDPEIPIVSSPLDYIFRRLTLDAAATGESEN